MAVLLTREGRGSAPARAVDLGFHEMLEFARLTAQNSTTVGSVVAEGCPTFIMAMLNKLKH